MTMRKTEKHNLVAKRVAWAADFLLALVVAPWVGWYGGGLAVTLIVGLIVCALGGV